MKLESTDDYFFLNIPLNHAEKLDLDSGRVDFPGIFFQLIEFGKERQRNGYWTHERVSETSINVLTDPASVHDELKHDF